MFNFVFSGTTEQIATKNFELKLPKHKGWEESALAARTMFSEHENFQAEMYFYVGMTCLYMTYMKVVI